MHQQRNNNKRWKHEKAAQHSKHTIGRLSELKIGSFFYWIQCFTVKIRITELSRSFKLFKKFPSCSCSINCQWETHHHPKKLCCSEANLPINKWLCDSRPPSYHRLPAHCRVGLLAQSSFMTHLFQLQQLKMAHLNSGETNSASKEKMCCLCTARDLNIDATFPAVWRLILYEWMRVADGFMHMKVFKFSFK